MVQRRRVTMRLADAAKFTDLRLERGLTQREIARRADVDESLISQMLNGKGCSKEVARYIADAFGAPKVRVQRLFVEEEIAIRRSKPQLPVAS